jgi:hypothetical protein
VSCCSPECPAGQGGNADNSECLSCSPGSFSTGPAAASATIRASYVARLKAAYASAARGTNARAAASSRNGSHYNPTPAAIAQAMSNSASLFRVWPPQKGSMAAAAAIDVAGGTTGDARRSPGTSRVRSTPGSGMTTALTLRSIPLAKCQSCPGQATSPAGAISLEECGTSLRSRHASAAFQLSLL